MNTLTMKKELVRTGREVTQDLQLLGFTTVVVGSELIKASAKTSVAVAQTANLGLKAVNAGLDRYIESTESIESLMSLFRKEEQEEKEEVTK